MVFQRLPEESDQNYELTIISQDDPSFQQFYDLCTLESQGKRFGLL
jgi:hypothetical protein